MVMKRKKFFKKMRKFFILPLCFLVLFFSFGIFVNADSLIYQSNPFIIQGTGTDNGEIIADVSPVAFLFEKRGHSEVVNNEIVDANGQYLYNIGRNQWDEEWEVGRYSTSTGVKEENSSTFRCENFIRVIPSTSYYLNKSDYSNVVILSYDSNQQFLGAFGNVNSGTFTTLSNASYITFYVDDINHTYNDDITISLYYADEEGYDEHYPYEVVSYVDTGNEVLRSINDNLYDVKLPNGEITRNVGTYTFTGSETFSRNMDAFSNPVWIGTISIPTSATNKINGINGLSSKLLIIDDLYVDNIPDYSMTINNLSVSDTNGIITIRIDSISTLSDLQSFLTGMTLYFELAAPTTEQGTSYSLNYYVDDFGSQYWLDENMNFVEVGQAGLYGYNFDFVYSWGDNIFRMIVAPFEEIGNAVFSFIKDGFVTIFVNQVEVEVDGVTVTQYHPSEIAYYSFALMGLALLLGLCYYLVKMLRRSR